jgi:DNA-directed RNA polymerase specialized sigma24 family protein
MGLFISAGTSSVVDGPSSTTSTTVGHGTSRSRYASGPSRSLRLDRDRLLALRKQQSEVIELLNVGEAINSRDFEERCAEDRNLTSLSFEASERTLQEIEVQDFINKLPSDLADLVDLLDEGLTTREIASIKGVAKGTIQYRIEKLRSITRAYFASAVAA